MSTFERTNTDATAIKEHANKSGNAPRKKGQPISFVDHIKAAKANTEKETSEKHQTLSQAKGRAQITATSAMSIVNVALLKNVIDQGPENNKYYNASLVMLSVSLGLQVFAGILSLVIEHMLSYMSKYGQNMCEDFRDNCCPWRCVRAPPKHNHKDIETGHHERATSKGTANPVFDLGETLDSCGAYNVPMSQKGGGGECGCCPFLCTTEVYNHYDYSALQKYYQWKCKSVDVELDAIKAEDELEYQNQLIQAINEKLLQISSTDENKATTSSNIGDVKVSLEELRERLAEAVKRTEQHEAVIRKADTVRDQGLLLKDFAESTRKYRVIMLSAFWQHILNYVFFIIFILNAFITGIGLAASSPPDVNQVATVAGNRSMVVPQ